MSYLLDRYGYCIIPKNTILFRGHNSNAFTDCMFFATKHDVANAFEHNAVQIWNTTEHLKVLFLVEYLNSNAWAISALPAVFNCVMPKESDSKFSDLDIKHWNLARRDVFVKTLFKEHQTRGWLTSVEGRIDIEVCLFERDTNKKQLILLEERSNPESYFKDSLSKIKVFPSDEFYIKTQENLAKHSSNLEFKEYKRMVNYWIRKKLDQGMERNRAVHYYYDLRIKLKL